MTTAAAAQASTENLDAVFKALASSHRREILAMLSAAESEGSKTCCAADEVCACKISERLGLSASTTSHHMSILRDAGLVIGRNEGTWTYYTLCRDALSAAAEALTRL